MSRPRLLFLSHRLPYPPHNGAAIRTFNVLALLARHYDITALCFDRRDQATSHIPLQDRLAALSATGTFEVFAIPQERNRLRMLWDHLRSVGSGRAYTYFLHDSREFGAALRRAMSETSFDLVHVDSLDLVRYLDAVPPQRVILTHHNVESLLLQRRAAAERSIPRRAYLAFQAGLLSRAERYWIPRVGLNVVVSAEDQRQFTSSVAGGRYLVVPNGVDVRFFSPLERERSGMVFVGGTSYFPNLDAIRWFVAEVLPELRRRGCVAPARFVGRSTSEEQAEYSRDGLSLTGYVDDVRPLIAEAACFVVPLRVGGGTRLKLLDAWAMGKAVVSTRMGAEGLATEEGTNILLRDDAQGFARAVIDVLGDSELRARLERGARRTAEEKYSWEVIERSMIAGYEQVRQRAGARPSAAAP